MTEISLQLFPWDLLQIFMVPTRWILTIDFSSSDTMRLTFGLVGGFPWALTLTLEVVDDILHHNLEAARTLQACCWHLDAILVVDAFTGLRGWNPLLLQFPPTFQPPCHRELISLNLQAGQGRAGKQSLVDKDMADCSLDPHFLLAVVERSQLQT